MLRFTKMHGLGNDFVVIDGVTQPVRLTHEQISQLGDRHRGIGFDQLLLVEPPGRPDVDFNYRIFNADGGEVEQCGNGARCFARFVLDQRLTQKRELRVQTAKGIIELKVTQNGWVRVDMGAPELDPPQIPFEAAERKAVYELEAEGQTWQLSAVSMGNPHGVLVVDNVDNAPVATVGPTLENHPAFPDRANIGFMQVLAPDRVRLRVFERGVGETLACGSGACAAVVAGRLRGLLDERVTVELLGGELVIEWRGEGTTVIMEGPTARVFEGHIKLPGEKKRRPGRGGRGRKDKRPASRKGRKS
ncbi:diaminopimelate epimerase [Marinobacteraceae bacterium S3BR75-40.1]